MRPVTKPIPVYASGESYPYYTDPSLDLTIPFAKGSATANAFGGPPKGKSEVKKSVRDLQKVLLDEIAPPPKTAFKGKGTFKPTAKSRSTALSAITGKLNVQYRRANTFLSELIGPICSYCETSFPGQVLQVEHRLAKSEFPTLYVWWDNFLQGCPNCNPNKGVKPTRAQATGWVVGAKPTEDQLIDAARDKFMWPDKTIDSFRDVTFGMLNRTANATVPLMLAANIENKRVGFQDYKVRADIQLALTIVKEEN